MDDPIAKLEAAARAKGLQMVDVLREAGVATTTYARWTKGEFEPRLRTLKKLQEVIDRRNAA